MKLATLSAAAGIAALGFGGVANADSFADSVAAHTDVAPFAPGCCDDATDALGAPNASSGPFAGFVSLTTLDSLEVDFDDNVCLVGAGDDLRVFEFLGTESFTAAVAFQGGAFSPTVAGNGTNAATETLDFSGVFGGPVFNQVRIVSTSNGGAIPGADIDAVQCLDSAAAVNEDDTCDVGSTGNDVDTVLAYSDGTSIFVHLNLCDVIETKVKYRVHFDYTDQSGDPDNNDPDTPTNAGCVTTSDDTMMLRGSRETGPGDITTDTDMVWYEVDYAELAKNGAILGSGDQVLIWVDTQFKGINDRAPNVESGDGCSKPQIIGEVIDLTLE